MKQKKRMKEKQLMTSMNSMGGGGPSIGGRERSPLMGGDGTGGGSDGDHSSETPSPSSTTGQQSNLTGGSASAIAEPSSGASKEHVFRFTKL